jgi:hypothetical protein
MVGGEAGLRGLLPDRGWGVFVPCYLAAWESTLYQGRTRNSML